MSGDNERFTLDTNLLVYSVDRTAGHRHRLGGVAIHNPFAAAGGLTERARGLLGL